MTDAAATTSELHRLWHGRDDPPAERQKLRAGPVECELEGVDLRYVRAGDVELVRRLYVAVRDRNWATLPIEVSDLELDDRGDSFRLTFEARHRLHEIDFRWRGELEGGADGSIDYALHGVAESEFLYNRIGFCILHPAENAGQPYRARTPDGTLTARLPDTIGPQLWERGFPKPIFPSFDGLEIEVADDLHARFEFEGDLFEMEDQRNWTDASFKTYSTPLQLGYPHRAERGKQIEQRVRLTLEGQPGKGAGRADEPIRVELGEPVGPLPAFGLGQSSQGGGLSPREVELLRVLQPDHLRVELKLAGEWRGELERGAGTAKELGCALELAAVLGDEPEPRLERLAAELERTDARVARVLVFKEGEHSTGASSVRLARERLRAATGGAPFAGGSNALFTEVNRTRPDVEAVDGVAYALNATVHADDDTSVMETAAVHGETVRTAKAFSGLPVHVGPVTFNQRYNPVATGPEPELDPDELPPQVDPRQTSLLGAAWTLSSARSLAEAGAASVTYFETTGWRGVVETEEGSPVPERFHSQPGAAFPLYHVLADLGDSKRAEVIASRSSRPLAVEALALRGDGVLRVLVANLTPASQRCVVGPLPDGEVSRRVLDERTAVGAGQDPQGFRAMHEPAAVSGGQLELDLRPYAFVRIDG